MKSLYFITRTLLLLYHYIQSTCFVKMLNSWQFIRKRFLVSQLDVIKNQNWVDEMNADEKSYIKLPPDLLEHFLRGLSYQKSNSLFSKKGQKFNNWVRCRLILKIFWNSVRNGDSPGPWTEFWECGCQSTNLPNKSVNWHPHSLKFIMFSKKSVGAN